MCSNTAQRTSNLWQYAVPLPHSLPASPPSVLGQQPGNEFKTMSSDIASSVAGKIIPDVSIERMPSFAESKQSLLGLHDLEN